MTEDFRHTLYDVLDDLSVGDIQFGVLKTFYEEDVHKLYDELIDTLPEDKMKGLDAILQRVGVKMFLYYLYKYRNTVNPCYSPTEDKECIGLADMFNNRIRLAMFEKLHGLSVANVKINVTLDGVAQHGIDYADFTTELYALAKRYRLYVTSFDVPPMRFQNKYEIDDLKESQATD